MATILDKTITRNSGNIINTNTNYSELNTKASGLVNDIVSHVETQIQTTETALQASENLVDAKIASLLSVGDTGYTKDVVDTNFANQINALAPYSGYTSVSKKLDNFVFQESTSFLNKVADKNRYVKFGDKVVDTYGEELVTNGDFSNGTTGWIGIDGQPWYIEDGVLKRVISSDAQEVVKSITTTKASIIKVSVKNHNENGTVILRINGGANDINITSQTSATPVSTTDIAFIDNGVLTAIITSNISSIGFRSYSATAYCEFDNISVKEIQTAQFTVPEVSEIITDSSNTTSVAVNAGDYVVDGSELVTNGTFDTDTSGWSAYGTASLSHSLGEAKVVTTTTPSTGLQMASPASVVIGAKYVLTFDVYSTSGLTSLYLREYNHIDANITGITSTKKTFSYTFYGLVDVGNEGLQLQFRDLTSSAHTFYIDNISVKRVSDTFRAIQDAPIGTALTDTTYFQDRTEIGVTNQQLSYHAYNTLTNSYEGIKTEVLFSDVSKEDLLDNSVWMARNGFSKVSQFLYSKGAYLVAPIGIFQSLNKGAYHPVFNPMGTSAMVSDGYNGRAWYEGTTNEKFLGTYSAFVFGNNEDGKVNILKGSISSTDQKRPDGKAYDIIYEDQFTDVREYAKILNKDEVAMIVADKEDNGVEEVVFTQETRTSSNASLRAFGHWTNSYTWFSGVGEITYTTGDTALILIDNLYQATVIITGKSYESTRPYYFCTVIDGSLVNNTTATSITVSIVKTKPILSSNTKLSIDLIGSPSVYPQILKDRLASGVGVVGINPLLVSDTGDNLIPDGTSKDYKASEKVENIDSLLYSNDSGTTYGDDTSSWQTYFSLITNSRGKTVPLSQLLLLTHTSKNQPYIQTTPKPVIDVEPKVIASNSHSIYKGALIGNQVAGKVQVGNGTNGYESKVLENSEIASTFVISNTTDSFSVGAGDSVLLLIDGTHSTQAGKKGIVYEAPSAGTASAGSSFESGWWTIRGYTDSTPQHSTIALDNANSPASKWFNTLSQGDNGVVGSVYGKEMVWDYSADNESEFVQITTESLSRTNHPVGTLLRIESDSYGPLSRTSIEIVYAGSYTISQTEAQTILSVTAEGDFILGDGIVLAKLWDGNGFGDDNEFEQLTNGTVTDLNGNTTRTFVGHIAINGEVK